MTNVFEQIRHKWHNHPYILYIFVIAFVLFIFSLILFWEDAKSSRDGFESLEQAFGVEFGNYWITYWVIAFIPQFAQVFFFYLLMTDVQKNWWWAVPVIALFFIIDFTSDVQDRSGQQLMPLDGSSPQLFTMPILIASLFTLTFITIGSEVFFSATIGVMLVIWPHALAQFGIQKSTYKQAIGTRQKQRQPQGQPQGQNYGQNQPSQGTRPDRRVPR